MCLLPCSHGSVGLALENFNAFGRFRSTERQQPIDPAGEMITGETFAGVAELKDALVKNHKMEFYRTLTGKLLTYVLGPRDGVLRYRRDR